MLTSHLYLLGCSSLLIIYLVSIFHLYYCRILLYAFFLHSFPFLCPFYLVFISVTVITFYVHLFYFILFYFFLLFSFSAIFHSVFLFSLVFYPNISYPTLSYLHSFIFYYTIQCNNTVWYTIHELHYPINQSSSISTSIFIIQVDPDSVIPTSAKQNIGKQLFHYFTVLYFASFNVFYFLFY